MSDESCNCGCNSTPETETKKSDDCSCGCGGTGETESKEDAVV